VCVSAVGVVLILQVVRLETLDNCTVELLLATQPTWRTGL